MNAVGMRPVMTYKQRYRAYLADAAGHIAEDDVLVVQVCGHCFAAVEIGHRGGHRGGVNNALEAVGDDPGGHVVRVGRDEERAACESRVQEVLADAAVELLDNNYGKEGANDGQPQRRACRHRERHEQTGERCGAVADGAGLLHKLAISPLEEHGGSHGDEADGYRIPAELDDGDDECRHERDDNIDHDASGVGAGPDLRLVRYVKDDLFFLIVHYFASFAAASAAALAFSLSALARNISFAVLNA